MHRERLGWRKKKAEAEEKEEEKKKKEQYRELMLSPPTIAPQSWEYPGWYCLWELMGECGKEGVLVDE